ncbi:sanpodo [Arctopsyche grandis]|uniref:sanpodo n=1 Tax=Arctopsyche grandis TaxID=121162 RepID=UPI00406D7EAA
MDSPKITYKYYSNPAFCAQSEVVYTQQTPCVSPRITTSPHSKSASLRSKRIPPLGANSPRKVLPHQEYRSQIGNQRVRTDISDNPLRNVHAKTYANTSQQNEAEPPPKPGPKPSRHILIRIENQKAKTSTKRNGRNAMNTSMNESAYSRGEELEMYKVRQTKSEDGTDSNAEEETVISSRVLKHRYAEIPDDYDDYSPSKKRIIETEPVEYNVDKDSEDECKEIPTEIVRAVNGKIHRYAIIPSDDEDGIVANVNNQASPPTFHLTSPGMSRKNLEATQKLHELLATPKKVLTHSPLKSCTSSPSLRSQMNSRNVMVTPSKPILSSTPKQILNSSKSCANLASPPLPRRNTNLNSSISPRAQQRLNYGIVNPNEMSPRKQGPPNFYVRERSFDISRESNRSYDMEANKDFNKIRDNYNQQMLNTRSTAIISPRMISRRSVSSIYSDGTVFSSKRWSATPGCATLVLAAAMLALCGGLAAALSFYMMYTVGRQYYLDISVLSGFTCFLLGLLGLRTRTDRLLPNRNYISGYIVISILSLLSCGALLTLLCTDPGWGGGNLREMIGGAVTTMDGLCLILASIGAVSSCCCGQPPPDNRVANATRS